MKISVIIPTYKPQSYIWECLDSLANQTFTKEQYEVILVLNGCNDPYRTQLKDHINQHKGVNWRFFHTMVGGVSNARNIALNEAKGEYITFIDDDDFVSQTYLQELYEKSSKDTVGVCYPLSFEDGTKDYRPYYITKDYEQYAIVGKVPFYKPRRFFAGPVYKLIHRDIIGARRFDVRFKNGEDSLFMFLISDRIKYVDFASKNAVYYRRERDNSASSNQTQMWFNAKNRLRLIKALTNIYKSSLRAYNFSFYRSMIMSSVKAIMYEIGRKFMGLSKV